MARQISRREFLRREAVSGATVSLGILRSRGGFGAQRLSLDPAAVKKFGASLKGSVILPGEPGYESARRVWNWAVDRHPAMVVRCAGTADADIGAGHLLSSRSIIRGTGERARQRIFAQRRRGTHRRGDLPQTRRHSACDRACRGKGSCLRGEGYRDATGRPARFVEIRPANRKPTTPNVESHTRLEP